MTQTSEPRSERRMVMLAALTGVVVVHAVLALLVWRRQDYGALVWLAASVALYAIRFPHSARRHASRIVERRADVLERLVLAAMTATMMALPFVWLASGAPRFADYALPPAATVLGAMLLASAVWLFWRSHADLGRNWSPTLELRDGHGLVTGGVYARIRHPMYAAVALFSAAQPLLLHNWIAGPLVLLAFTALWLVRVPREEAMMRDRFGAEWNAYVARTGRLLPKRKA